MSKLNVIDHEGLLVVDSRLIALELGIQHKNFLATLDKYGAKMAESPVVKPPAFETRELKTIEGNMITERWAWLTEPQANFLMTLSRNTEQVVNCKLKLVEAFETAKLALSEVVNLRVAELEEKLAVQGRAIALLQSQIQKLLPISSDFIPPGWDADVWEKLPPQDKRHFRFIYQKHGFQPDPDPEPTLSISADARRKQRQEMERIIGNTSPRVAGAIEE